jgi:hypothetical protein
VKELLDSASLADDPDSLRARLSVYGYLFFRGLLPTGPVNEAGATVAARLSAGGWIGPSGIPSSPQRALNAADAIRDPAFLAALTSRAFNRIPYLPELRGLVRSLLGGSAFSYPVKVLRAVYPETRGSIARGRYIHQDFAVARVPDLLTSWIPLMPIPVRLGGLGILPGSNLGPPRAPRPLSPHQPGWYTTDYGVGDVLLFHCLTSHAALPNRSARLRLSQDSRWQTADQPAPTRMVYGPAGRRAQEGQGRELYSRLLYREPWWEPLPPTIVIADHNRQPPGPPRSRFFPVHPGWSTWEPPAGPVH